MAKFLKIWWHMHEWWYNKIDFIRPKKMHFFPDSLWSIYLSVPLGMKCWPIHKTLTLQHITHTAFLHAHASQPQYQKPFWYCQANKRPFLVHVATFPCTDVQIKLPCSCLWNYTTEPNCYHSNRTHFTQSAAGWWWGTARVTERKKR